MTVQKMALMHLSEEDFHQIMAESIEVGRLESFISISEITTGLLDISPDSSHIPKWYSNPKFSRFLVHKAANNDTKIEYTAMASIQDQLQNCQTQQELSLLVQQSFGAQLRKMLQTPSGVSDEEILSKRGLELGLDSLVSVDIRSWFLRYFQLSIPILKIMSNDTMANIIQSAIKDIPTDMVPKMASSQAENSKENTEVPVNGVSAILETCSRQTSPVTIDWDTESTPPARFSSISVIPSSTSLVPPRVFVLTGVTGLLGRYILESLLKNKFTTKIYCLAVRKLTDRLQAKELLVDSRIQYYGGTLSEPLLGLSEPDASLIFAHTDAVIHNGADTSHIKNYTKLQASNVGSTITLTQFCLPRRIPMHYISSAGVAIYSGQESFPEVSVAGPGSIFPAADGSFGYGCSKWANERFLERTHEQYRLPVSIYRPSTIIREGFDATTSRAELDWVNALLQYIRKIKAAPNVQHNYGWLDLVSIKSCCTTLLENIANPEARTGLRYVHMVGDLVIPMNRLQDIDAAKGLSYNILPISKWIEKAVDAGLHPAVGSLIKAMDADGISRYPRLLKNSFK
jgi:nucleoside-diphosphate-sugar epimerase